MGMWSSLGGLAGAAVGSLVGMPTLGYGIGSSLGSNYDSNRAFDKQKDLNWEMWNAENEYNKPVNQMARLREAGLNPNLVYGSGATTLSASTKGSPSYQIPQLDALQMMNSYQDLRQKDATTENIKAQKQVNHANAREAEARAKIAEKDAKIYMETGVHPARDIDQNLPSMLRTSVGTWSSPVTNFIGDRITAFSRKWNSEPDTDIIGRLIRKKGGLTPRQQKIYNSYKKQLGF